MKIYFMFFIFFGFLNIVGCVSKIDISPDYLKPAFLNKYYEQVIEIEKINLVGEVVVVTDLKDDSGIKVAKIGEDEYFYENTIKIYGIPKNAGKYHVELRGYYRGGVGGSSVKFNKKYDLVINEK